MAVDIMGVDKIGSRRSGNKPNLTCHLCKKKKGVLKLADLTCTGDAM